MISLFDDFETRGGEEDHSQGSITVSELTRDIKLLLEEGLPAHWVEGEISNFKHHSSGHFYFSLKDENAQINCVMWRGRNQSLLFRPEDGMKVLALGRVTVYEKQGRYQLDLVRMQPLGSGELQMAFEALKQRLHSEGLFDADHKQELPEFPETIGIVTSSTGAAIRDIVSVIERRFRAVKLLIRPVRVQGAGAAEEIAEAIDAFNQYGEVDLLIVGRGGGSIEDLWPFNEEIVARSIYHSKIPVISAVGHEIDFTISDFVADYRAPTPSAAAEMAVHDSSGLLNQIDQWQQRLKLSIQSKIDDYRLQLATLSRSYGLRQPENQIREFRLQLDDVYRQLTTSQRRLIEAKQNRLAGLRNQLHALNPEAVLSRGYSITTSVRNGCPVLKAEDVEPGDAIDIRLSQGRIIGRVEETVN